ncbi:putative glycoside hydrolase [Ralstonia soli]|uniref:Glycoside hydrolase n=1 Tax=Ralstonia soli TaxID=2953896 RepID=A0ABT1AKB8_9RALS|nr:putative glycoside hydrolase [Ralstonia soli]MCO5398860.1 putative glycoside hydrolase [Ralstonia soli]
MSSRLCLWFAAVWLGCAGLAGATELRVVDAHSHTPIEGAITLVEGQSRTTDAAGRVAIPESALGAHATVSVRAPGYARAELPLESGKAAFEILLKPIKPRAVYLSVQGVSSQVLRDAAVALQGATAINALVIDMKGDRGDTPYPSAARVAVGAAREPENRAARTARFAALVRQLRSRGLYLIARIVVFKDDRLAEAHPEWTVRDRAGDVWRDGEGQRWIDPSVEAAWGSALDVAEEAARLGFDEIQFDYLRFPDANGLQFHQANTQAHRVAAITGFLAQARERLRAYNIYLAADIFGYVCWNTDDTAIGQQIETLGAVVDYISPMLYPSGFTWGLPGCRKPTERPGEIVARSLAEAKRRTGLPGVRFRPWLQAFRDYAFDHREFNAEMIRAQVEAADAEGTNGWMLWNARNRYAPANLPR